jgi:phosphatidylserine/phosphatidylglycerophosphate/cardiolipin synthase-like enzyme
VKEPNAQKLAADAAGMRAYNRHARGEQAEVRDCQISVHLGTYLAAFFGAGRAACNLGPERGRKVSLSQTFITAAVVLALCSQGRADPAPVIRYASGENLEHIDVALIDRAEHEIDMAAYVLMDWPVMQALTRAADRGVKVRIYLDGKQFSERESAKVFNDPDAPQELPNRWPVTPDRCGELSS